MNYLLFAAIPFLLGHYTLEYLTKRTQPFFGKDFFWALGLGFGISSHLVFYSLLVFDQLYPLGIILLHILLLLILFALSRRTRKTTEIEINTALLPLWKFFLLFSPLVIFAVSQASNHPFGEWDAWSLWNLRANFIFRAGSGWSDIFTAETQAHHPWFLPLIVIWGWCLSGREDYLVPLVFGIIFTVMTVGILVDGLGGFIGRRKSFLVGLFLFSVPYFIEKATNQYADILVAYYLLAVVVHLTRALQEDCSKNALLIGIFLGLLSFTKDEGIFLALILWATSLIYLRKEKIFPVFFKNTLAGGLIFAAPTFFAKMVMAPAFPKDGVLNLANLGDLSRWLGMVKFILSQIVLNPAWGGLGAVVLSWIIVRKYFTGGKSLAAKIILRGLCVYLALVVLRFIMAPIDLSWLMNVSLGRVLLQLVPASLFLIFYTLSSQQPA